uniref:Uncharacterized protein n=1 Tax=Anguilla anguilla TaxID=7936 RepID=A0A0E9PZL1_ANGAN
MKKYKYKNDQDKQTKMIFQQKRTFISELRKFVSIMKYCIYLQTHIHTNDEMQTK